MGRPGVRRRRPAARSRGVAAAEGGLGARSAGRLDLLQPPARTLKLSPERAFVGEGSRAARADADVGRDAVARESELLEARTILVGNDALDAAGRIVDRTRDAPQRHRRGIVLRTDD